MGKVSLSRPQPPTPEPTPEPKKLIPKLTKKELINVVVYTGGVLLIGFVIGLLSHPLFSTTHVVRFRSDFDQMQLDLENKLESASKKLNGIEEPLCGQCYGEEAVGSSSKRVKENLKSGIGQLHFVKDYVASPHYSMFEYSTTHEGRPDNLRPFSFHISLHKLYRLI